MKIHANTTELSLTAKSPNTHVIPSIGNTTTAAFINALIMQQIIIYCSYNLPTIVTPQTREKGKKKTKKKQEMEFN